MYGLSREASAVRKDSNNLCRRQACQCEVSSAISNDKLGIHRNSSVMSEEELSFQGDREYPEKRDKVTISVMRISLQLDKVCVIPPYAERHLRWCESNEKEIRSENFVSLPTRFYIHTKTEREWAVCIVVGVMPSIGNGLRRIPIDHITPISIGATPIIGNASAVSIENAALYL